MNRGDIVERPPTFLVIRIFAEEHDPIISHRTSSKYLDCSILRVNRSHAPGSRLGIEIAQSRADKPILMRGRRVDNK